MNNNTKAIKKNTKSTQRHTVLKFVHGENWFLPSVHPLVVSLPQFRAVSPYVSYDFYNVWVGNPIPVFFHHSYLVFTSPARE